MKRILILFSIVLISFAGRADLVMQWQAVGPYSSVSVFQDGKILTGGTNWLNYRTVKIHGEKIRIEHTNEQSGGYITIRDLTTGDGVSLRPKDKTFVKLKRSGDTSAIFTNSEKFLDTGKTEKVGDYEAEVYSWTKTNGIMHETQKWWVAKDFPNYAGIKSDLDKLNQFNQWNPTQGSPRPDELQLPGMVVKKTRTDIAGGIFTTSLVSVKIEPVDSSEFEMPADYTERPIEKMIIR